MNRRQLLHAFAGMALGASPLVSAASIQRARDEKSVAIIAIGNPGIYAVRSVLEKLPVRIPNIAMGTSRISLNYVRTVFDQIHCIDLECLPEADELIPFHAVDENMWEEVRALLPKEQRWLIVGSLSGATGSALIPVISREANQSGRRAHVFAMGLFAMGPLCLEDESAFRRAELTRIEVDRWAAECVMVPNYSWLDTEATLEDYVEEIDSRCLTWCDLLCKSS